MSLRVPSTRPSSARLDVFRVVKGGLRVADHYADYVGYLG